MHFRHPAGVDCGVADILSRTPGVELLQAVSLSLHAIAFIRAFQPDLIVLETDGCESDSVSLLTLVTDLAATSLSR